MRQFFKKALAVVLTGVLLAGASISAAAAPQELSVTPTVASGEAAVEGDVITLTEGKAATVAFQPSQELDIIEYQYSLAQPSDTNETIVDVTDWETADSLVPAYSFSGLKEGTYQITLTLTENTGYTTVFQKEYTVKVQAAPVPVTVAPAGVSGKADISGDVITLTEGTAATIAFQPSPALDIFGYQHSFRQPESTLSLIEDVTDWETADTLVPTYFFSGELKEGTYQIALTLTENTGYTTVFEKEYTIQVVASEPEEPETPDVVIDQDKDVPQVSLGMDQAELAESLLTEEEINAGAQIVISVEKAELSEQQKELFERIHVGDTVEGVVKNVTDFGAFIDLGGADGLLHISEMSWGHVENPKKVFKVGEKLNVLIKDIKGEKIALSLKFEDQNPWLTAADKYAVGNVVEGRVARMTDFGAFVELEPGVDALLHVSQISHDHVDKPSDILKVGEIITAKVVDFNGDDKKISLSMKALENQAPAEETEE